MENQTEEKKETGFQCWHGCLGGCLGTVALAIITGVVIALLPESEPEITQMDQWEVAKCGSKDFVLGIHYTAYGLADFGHGGRFGWASESAEPSSFPKWYYYTVARKNAFGTETITETASLWDYNCNLLRENSRIVGFE